MRARLTVFGLIVAGSVVILPLLVAILPLLYWLSYLALGFDAQFPWAAAIFFGYEVLPVSGLLLILLGLKYEGEMSRTWAIGFMVSSLLLGILAFVIASLFLPGIFSSLSNVVPFLENLGALTAAFLSSWKYIKKVETGPAPPAPSIRKRLSTFR